MNKYLGVFLILYLIYKLITVERFEELFLINYSKLNIDHEIRIIIDDIKHIFEINSYFSSKFKCDQFLLLLDSIIEDYNAFSQKNCSLQNIKKYTNQSQLDIMKSDLKQYLINETNFISINYKNVLNIKIQNFTDIIFNEFILNCS